MATVYVNYALLRVQQARRSAHATLTADHDLFGDIAAAQGDVAQQQGLAAAL